MGPSWYWGYLQLLICICDVTVGDGVHPANPKLHWSGPGTADAGTPAAPGTAAVTDKALPRQEAVEFIAVRTWT
jgi:hypothetical protein